MRSIRARVVQRLQRHQHLHRRAVRVGDDVVLAVAGDRVRIHLGDHQRNVVLVAELRGVVDDDAARLAGAHGACTLETLAPAENRPICTLREVERLPGPAPAAPRRLKRTVAPDRARARERDTARRPGSCAARGSTAWCSPTRPVAPTTATFQRLLIFLRRGHPFSAARTLHETPRADKERGPQNGREIGPRSGRRAAES